jgi:hypothetical protein
LTPTMLILRFQMRSPWFCRGTPLQIECKRGAP